MPEDIPVAGTVVLLRDGAAGIEVLMIRRPDRGSFAGGWVFPGGKVEDADRVPGADEQGIALRAAVRETFEEVGLQVDAPVIVSRWRPPMGIPSRIRTWFFLARDPGDTLAPAPDEVVDTIWLGPADVLARHSAGDWILFPPTWVTLHHLMAFDDVASALAAAGKVELYSTQPLPGMMVWEGDVEHGHTPGTGLHRLLTATLPWEYVRR